tara:strand:- start:1327 stop:1518 length:192 start_codon:yes stop_codon:yes gene_type:complete
MKATIQFEIIDPFLTPQQLEDKLIEKIYKEMELWMKGKGTIEINFEPNTLSDEYFRADNQIIN